MACERDLRTVLQRKQLDMSILGIISFFFIIIIFYQSEPFRYLSAVIEDRHFVLEPLYAWDVGKKPTVF